MACTLKKMNLSYIRSFPVTFRRTSPKSTLLVLARSLLSREKQGIIRVSRVCAFSYSTSVRYNARLLHCGLKPWATAHYSTAASGKVNDGSQMNLSDDACPQGIQGDNCINFKLWMDNCRRYGLANCNEQLQGIQSGRRTLAEVMAEQDQLIADIAEQYRQAANKHRWQGDAQGVQGEFAAFPEVDSPCPQGVQGYDCARFKIWLENCHRFGLHNCLEQYEGFKAGRQSLAEIFAEQDRMIREAATVAYQKASQQRRKYSTSTDNSKPGGIEGDAAQLTQRQKLQRAVKEYGSTVIVFHITISLMSLGFFYMLVSSGIDVVGIMTKLGIGGSLLENKLAAGTGTFVMAYAVHKVFAPVRIATTLTATPFIVRYLRRIGILKVPGHAKIK